MRPKVGFPGSSAGSDRAGHDQSSAALPYCAISNAIARSNIHLHSNCIKLGYNNRPNRRNDNAFQPLPQFRFSTEGACDIAEPSNLRRTCKGDRVDPAGSHFGNDGDHARIVDFRSVDIWKHVIPFCPGAFEEFQKSLIRYCQDIAARRPAAR